MDSANLKDNLGAGQGAGGSDDINMKGSFEFTCYDADGNVRWKDKIENTVVTVGKNDMENKYFAGSSYTATWYMGLISSVGYSAIAAADTMSSHAGWQEAGNANAPTYSQANRPTVTFNAAASGNVSSNGTVAFSITGNGTAKGAFMTTVNTKDGTTGTLFSAGLFTQGDRVVVNGDTINGSYTLALT